MAPALDHDQQPTRMIRPVREGLKRRYDEIARRAASYLRQEYPGLLGILVHGSVARGEPGPFSDIDMVAVTNRRKPSPFSYFDEGIYVGVDFQSLRHLQDEFTSPVEFFWARGSASDTRILYDPRGILHKIVARWGRARPSHQVLETSLWDAYHNIIEYSGKLRNGWVKHDEYLTRYSARVIAQHVGRALIALNHISVVSENYVWHQILKAKRRPRHFGIDFPLALGIRGTLDTGKVYRAGLRLCGEALRLIREEFGEKAKHYRFRALLREPLENHGL